MAHPRSVDDVLRLRSEGRPVEFLFFWSPDPGPGDGPGPGCLSQWWPAPFTVRGVTYPTAEHFMMAAKARHFGDTDAEAAVLSDADPAHAKAVGREVRGFVSAEWARHRVDVVTRGNDAKFGQHPRLAEYLRATGAAVLVEASPEDRTWGIGFAAEDPAASEPERWTGRNLLGFALADVRAGLRGTR